MGIQLRDLVENIAGKEEIARYEQFLLFPQCFQKLSVVDAPKWVSIGKRVNVLIFFHEISWKYQISNNGITRDPLFFSSDRNALGDKISPNQTHLVICLINVRFYLANVSKSQAIDASVLSDDKMGKNAFSLFKYDSGL